MTKNTSFLVETKIGENRKYQLEMYGLTQRKL